MMAPAIEEHLSAPHTNITINRPIYDLKTLKGLSKECAETEDGTLMEKLRKKVTRCKCSPKCCGENCLSFIPLAQKLKHYQWKRDIASDLIAGITVGVMHLPMGLAFANLANLPVVYGLYASFWPTLLYAFFGTGHHVSIGTMAVMSLLLGTVVKRRETALAMATDGPTTYDSDSNVTASDNSSVVVNITSNPDDIRIATAIGASFLMGIIQIVLSILQLGKIASFMSMSFISGFTTGAACHIVTSQVKSLFGLPPLPSHLGMFRLPLTWYEIFRHLPQTHIASLVLSLICMFCLLVMKYAINDNPKLKPYLKVPVPGELVVVVLAALISHFAGLNPKFGIKIIRTIPRGFPAPVIPDLSGATDFFVDSFIMAIVCFVISVAMASLFARKHSYEIDNNQEMFAYGIVHTVGAFFSSFAGAAAPPRCMVLDGTGAKSQVAALFSSIILLLIIVALGPLFQPLPHPSLAAIVVCALVPMFKQFRDPYDYWNISCYDTITWVVTWSCVVFIDVTIGLGIGIAFSIFTISFQSFLSKGYTLTNMTSTEVYVPERQDQTSPTHQSGIAVFRFESSLHFATRERFKQQLMQTTVSPKTLLNLKEANDATKSTIEQVQHNGKGEDSDNSKDADSPFIKTRNPSNSDQPIHPPTDKTTNNTPDMNSNLDQNQPNLHTIILDCSCISYVDMAGLHTLKMICMEYKKAGVEIVLANCSIALQETLNNAAMQDSCPMYATIHDAVLASKNKSYGKSPLTSNL